MKKRIFLTALWFYVAWYGAVMVASFAGVSQSIGPVVGALVAALVWFSPMLAARRHSDTSTATASFRSGPDSVSTR